MVLVFYFLTQLYAIDHYSMSSSTWSMLHVNDCKLCHTNVKSDRDQLVLLDGTITLKQESEKICAQCHGERYYEWKEGTHGKLTGGWKNPIRKLTCIECHQPHSPKFKEMTPEKPPVKPKFYVPKIHEE